MFSLLLQKKLKGFQGNSRKLKETLENSWKLKELMELMESAGVSIDL